MKILFILNDAPYGAERCYNALRLARGLVKGDPDTRVLVFLMADAVTAARKGQKTPEGYYNVERMLRQVLVAENAVLLCGTCMDAEAWATRTLSMAHAAARWTSWRQRHAPLTRC